MSIIIIVIIIIIIIIIMEYMFSYKSKIQHTEIQKILKRYKRYGLCKLSLKEIVNNYLLLKLSVHKNAKKMQATHACSEVAILTN